MPEGPECGNKPQLEARIRELVRKLESPTEIVEFGFEKLEP